MRRLGHRNHGGGFIALVKTKQPKIEVVRGTVTPKMLESRDAWLKEMYHKLIEKKLYMRLEFAGQWMNVSIAITCQSVWARTTRRLCG